LFDYKDASFELAPSTYGKTDAIMTALLSPRTLVFVSAIMIASLQASPNFALWAVCMLTLPLAIWLSGGNQPYPVLYWLVGVAWLNIVCDVASADMTDIVLSDGWLGPYRVKAILWSSCAILALAFGIRSGLRLGGSIFPAVVPAGGGSLAGNERGINLNRITACYFGSLILTQLLGAIASSIPILAQPVLALTLVKFVFIYILAAKVFESERGYGWLFLMSLMEMVTGLVGFFASYKEAFIVMLIALASNHRRASAGQWIFAATTVAAVIWVSLIWTTVKNEYRYNVFSYPIQERLEWMANRLFGDGNMDYSDAAVQLLARIGYTELYAEVLARQDSGALPSGFNFYASAVEHVLTPRILFPDKPALDDSKITTALLGVRIDDDTSIGVGFVAQAQVDFGFPGLLLPVLSMGFMIGMVAKYFMTRSAPLLVREAFTTATLFLSFQFAADIDKALGGFVVGCLAMGLSLKFGYPMMARWLEGSRVGQDLNANSPIKNLRA
jgi:hypothetical protein